MKNLLLILVVGICCIQCASTKKSEKETERARIESAYKVPQFSNQNAQDLAYEFAVFIDEIKVAMDKGEEPDLKEIQTKAMQFLDENKSKGETMSLEDTKKMTNWTMELIQKVLP